MVIVLAFAGDLICRLGFGDQTFGDWLAVTFLISAILVGLSLPTSALSSNNRRLMPPQ